MVRTRVIQTLFAYYKNTGKTPGSARTELRKSFADTYDLYFLLLDFINELTAYAQQQIEEQHARARAMHEVWEPNRRLVANRFAQQIFDNRALRARIAEEHLSWDSGIPAIHEIYRQLMDSDFYEKYIHADSCTYEDDKRVWRLTYQNLLLNSDTLADALDEMEVVLDKTNWTVDVDTVISYVIKTIKRFKSDSTPDTPLLEMFDTEDELQFATNLLDQAIANHSQFEELINSHLKGWEADRIAYMDRVIAEVALAEIMYFDDIAITVSLNEYIEIAKTYSGDKSYLFINGILSEIIRDLHREDGFIKGISIK